MAAHPDYFVPDMLRVVMARNPLLGQSSFHLIKLLRSAFDLGLAEAKPVGGWYSYGPDERFGPVQMPDKRLHDLVSPAIEAHRADWEREFHGQ